MTNTTRDDGSAGSAGPIVFGTTGLGGFAAHACEVLGELSDVADPAVRLHAVCEPDHVRHAEAIADLRRRGVRVLQDFDDLLAEPVEAVWLPLPIHLHRPFTERALAAGKAVLCEKPAAGCIQDVDAMIAAQRRSGLPVAVGYQHLPDPATLSLKRRLLAGDIGTVRRVTVTACWPRGDAYYGRNDWAGRLKHEGAWVLDSPANNALAHQLNLVMFLLGPEVLRAATPTAVEAELYRACPIESFNTITARVTSGAGPMACFFLTHACRQRIGPIIAIEGSRGRVEGDDQRWRLRIRGRDVETIERVTDGRRSALLLGAALHGIRDEHSTMCTLEIARAQSLIVSAANECAAIHDVPRSFFDELRTSEDCIRAISGIESIFEQCADRSELLHESGLAPWSRPASKLDVTEYRHFAGPAKAIGRSA